MTKNKYIILISIVFLSFSLFSQQITVEDWDIQSKTNIRLLPKYGNVNKTIEQKQADEEFINETIQKGKYKGDRSAASNYMIKLGFDYLNRGDIKTAMYRFNQSYLLDKKNTDIYWGFGAVYMSLGKLEDAEKQYVEGLNSNPKNTHLLTDYGTYFLTQFYLLQTTDEKKANMHLIDAIKNLIKSYKFDKNDTNTTYKLSICYFNQNDCKNAIRYYDECKKNGGQPIDEQYTNELFVKCKK
jgi:tetratricopeptide (TPR) repeat protein